MQLLLDRGSTCYLLPATCYLLPVPGYLVPDGCTYIHVSMHQCVFFVESCQHELFVILVTKYCETI